jgi:hypothetical protein
MVVANAGQAVYAVEDGKLQHAASAAGGLIWGYEKS